jgi:hypothetical protein
MSMTYKELLQQLQELDERQLNQSVLVYHIESKTLEPVNSADLSTSGLDGLIDSDHLFLSINN